MTATHGPEGALIDTIIVHELTLSPDDPLTNSAVYMGVYGLVALEMRFQVSCAINYYGSDCSTICMPVDDSTGHYRCTQNGTIECLSGYQNAQSNCTECIPAEGCCKFLPKVVWNAILIN